MTTFPLLHVTFLFRYAKADSVTLSRFLRHKPYLNFHTKLNINTASERMGKPVRSLFLSKIEENHMEETNVTMTTEKTQGEPAAKENETKAEKFIRIGEYRMNKAVDAIGRLENLANRSFYEYTQEQVDAMFQA